MTFPPPPPSSQSSIASGTDKSSSTRPPRAQQSAWGPSSASQSNVRRGLTPLATSNLTSSIPSSTSRGLPQSSSPGPGASTSSPLTSSFSAVLSSTRGLSGGRNVPSPASTSSPFAAFQSGSQQQQHHQQHQQPGQSVSSPKFRAHTPSGSYLASTAGSIVGGGGIGGGGGGTSSSRGAVFSPLSTTVNSPTGFPSDKPGSSAAGAAAHASQSSLTKISIAQVFLLLDSITEKEGKEK